jgi:hypothetical protein
VAGSSDKRTGTVEIFEDDAGIGIEIVGASDDEIGIGEIGASVDMTVDTLMTDSKLGRGKSSAGKISAGDTGNGAGKVAPGARKVAPVSSGIGVVHTSGGGESAISSKIVWSSYLCCWKDGASFGGDVDAGAPETCGVLGLPSASDEVPEMVVTSGTGSDRPGLGVLGDDSP